MKVEIYHNPRCTKSRETLKLIQFDGLMPIWSQKFDFCLSRAFLKPKFTGCFVVCLLRIGSL